MHTYAQVQHSCRRVTSICKVKLLILLCSQCSTSAEGNAAALKAGTDLNCESYADLRASYLQGLVTKADIERATTRVMEHKFRLGVMDPPGNVPFSDIPSSAIGAPHHLLKAVQAAQKGGAYS